MRVAIFLGFFVVYFVASFYWLYKQNNDQTFFLFIKKKMIPVKERITPVNKY